MPERETPSDAEDAAIAAFIRDERASLYATGIASLRAFIRDGCGVRASASNPFGELLRATVEDGVRRGWIRLTSSGYAVANSPEHWDIDGTPSEDPSYWEGLRARRDQRQRDVLADPARLQESIADRCEIAALNELLTLAPLQHAALRALDVRMTRAPMLESNEASILAYDLAMVANGAVNGVPSAMLERARPHVSTVRAMKSTTWEAGLMAALMLAEHVDRPQKRLARILEMLTVFAGEQVPDAFKRPTRKQLTAAREFSGR